MKNKLVLGPILGLESDALYTVTFVTDSSVEDVRVKYANKVAVASLLGKIHSGSVWRAQLDIPVRDQQEISYSIMTDSIDITDNSDRSCWSFYVPGKNEKPKI